MGAIQRLATMHRYLLLAVLAVLLAACGFQPRRAFTLPPDIGAVQVESADRYSRLADGLARSLERAGTNAAASEGQARLRILSEQWFEGPLSTDAAARIREYVTRYSVRFELVDAAGTARVPGDTVELSREYAFDATRSFGTPAEQEVIREELQRDMVAAILRRIDATLRAAD